MTSTLENYFLVCVSVTGAKMGEICVLRVSCRHIHLVEQKPQTGLKKKNVGIHALQSESLTSPLSYLTLYDVVCGWSAAIDFFSSKKKTGQGINLDTLSCYHFCRLLLSIIKPVNFISDTHDQNIYFGVVHNQQVNYTALTDLNECTREGFSSLSLCWLHIEQSISF